ncbi:hypothetical protein [Halioxenophilus sp. WMMB6]|uniref:hypothetical protein n=1 Tax=Halioxenophilus sp. WMMB6 TaxID=3073815 RepID=UPI00295F1045|nr:hypothetical protein [Halioxenophilus sp. WMMB6]
MIAFRALLLICWFVIVMVTANALASESLKVAIDVYSFDLAAGNWRTQYCSDLLLHLGLIGLWASWRSGFSARGIVLGSLCFLGGSLFSFAYLSILLFYHKGDIKKVVVGCNIVEENS